MSMETLLAGLRAAGESTRLRLLALCAHGELSVSELTEILGQSQPRVSRHLKLLVEAGLLTRFREGSLMFYRIADSGAGASLARTLVELLPDDDIDRRQDIARLDEIRTRRAEAANAFFRENAADWDRIRSLYAAEADVETRLLRLVGSGKSEQFVDIGTGTGRVLALLADRAERGVGIDTSGEMLAVARSALESRGLRHVHVRKGDMYRMPLDDASVDLATLHMVLHYSIEPHRVIAEAARVLREGGRLFIVDFAPHAEEHLRDELRHQRLGFPDHEIEQAMRAAGLEPGPDDTLVGDPLTIRFWQGVRRPRAASTERSANDNLHAAWPDAGALDPARNTSPTPQDGHA